MTWPRTQKQGGQRWVAVIAALGDLRLATLAHGPRWVLKLVVGLLRTPTKRSKIQQLEEQRSRPLGIAQR